ncbi:hypothetical protein R1flu_025025 [Riccia fluitans]|uniref:Uncharacterized protein n=1 Tax=Riccia fluitans TaxID=41844 RepID=A0ABD1Y0P7_9MARC
MLPARQGMGSDGHTKDKVIDFGELTGCTRKMPNYSIGRNDARRILDMAWTSKSPHYSSHELIVNLGITHPAQPSASQRNPKENPRASREINVQGHEGPTQVQNPEPYQTEGWAK